MMMTYICVCWYTGLPHLIIYTNFWPLRWFPNTKTIGKLSFLLFSETASLNKTGRENFYKMLFLHYYFNNRNYHFIWKDKKNIGWIICLRPKDFSKLGWQNRPWETFCWCIGPCWRASLSSCLFQHEEFRSTFLWHSPGPCCNVDQRL